MTIKNKHITPIFNGTVATLLAGGIIALVTVIIKPVRDFFLSIVTYRIPLYVVISAFLLVIGPLLIKFLRYRNKLRSMETDKAKLQEEFDNLELANRQEKKPPWISIDGR